MLGLDKGDVEVPVSDEFLTYKTASIVFEEAIKNIPGTHVHVLSEVFVEQALGYGYVVCALFSKLLPL